MKTFRDLFSAWGGIRAVAEDVGEKYQTVAGWKLRNSIPPKYWPRVVDAARRRGLRGINSEALMRLERGRAAA